MMSNKSSLINLFFLFSSIVILLIVYYLEIFYGLEPCKLCVYQRFPYFIVILLAISFLLINSKNFKKVAFLFYILIFFSSIILSVHHLGVENGLWTSLSNCAADFKKIPNGENLKDYLLNKNYVSCEDVSFKFLGISLAGYNMIISFILTSFSIIGFRIIKN